MKNFTLFTLVVFLSTLYTSLQGQIWTLDFETPGGYSTSITEFTDGSGDFWLRTDGTDHSSGIVYNGVLGSYYFAGMDLDGEGASLPLFINIDDIDISGQTNLEFRIYLAEDDDGTNQDWDAPDYFHIAYDMNNSGIFTNLLWVEAAGSSGSNFEPRIDTDFDGVGEGTEITDSFVQFTVSIPGTGNFLDLQLEFNLNSGDEDIAIDHLELFASGTPSPNISVSPPSLTGFYYVEGSGPSSSQSFTVEGSNLTTDITVTPSTNYEISSDDINFQLTPIILSQSGGSVASTTIYTRLQSGLSEGNYNENIVCSSTGSADKSISCNGDVLAPATTTIPYIEPFIADLGDCYSYNVSGATKDWYWNSGEFASMNGYNSGDTEEDWLILPGINLDNYSSENMSFDSWYRFGTDDITNYLKLYYSTDYSGLGYPSASTWVEMSFTQPSTDQTWTTSGNIDLSGISGSMVYIAFKYHYESGSYRWWEIDNLSIIEASGISYESNIIVTTGWSEPQNIDYTLYPTASGLTSTNALEVAKFTIQDGGDDMTDADILATILTDIEFQINHSDNIQALAIFEGTSNLQEITSVTSSTQFSGLTLTATDEGSKDFSLYATFKSTVTDNDNLWFNITAATADITGSGFADADAGGADTDNTGDNNKIVVTADRLNITTPTTVVINQDFPVTVDAKDINGNIDLDEISSVNLSLASGTGTLSSLTGLSQSLITGSFAWVDMQYDAIEDFSILASSTSLTNITSSLITATESINNNLIISEIADPSVPAQAKYIEIYNAGTTTIDFTAETWYISRHSYTSDCSPSTWYDYQLTGTIAPDECYIITSHPSSFDEAYGVGLYDRVAAGMNGNGNDPYMLYKNGDHTSGTLMDIYGTDECGDGLVWEYTDGHPVRHRDILSPSAVYDPEEWTFIPCDSSAMTVKEHRTTKYWDGLSSTDWNEKGTNWDRTYIPDASDNVYIPNLASNHPIVTLPGACNYLEIESSQDVTVNPGVFLVNVDTINNLRGTAGLVLKNDGTDYGSLLHDASLIPASVESFIAQEQWHIVSSPISNALSGVFLNLYLYSWLETDSTWHYIAPVDVPMGVGEGFYTWASNSLTGDKTVVYEGILNNGDININMPFTSGATHGGQGWSLIGNPFPSPVRFDNSWTLNNVAPTIYMYDGTQYKTWNTTTGGTLDTNIVAVGNGFWMKATAEGSVEIPQSSRNRYSSTFLKQEDVKTQLHFSLTGNGFSDEIIIDFRDDATNSFDEQYDALKLFGNDLAPQLYIEQEQENLSLSSVPFNEKLQIALHLKVGKTDTYHISLEQILHFKGDVYLKDILAGDVINLLENPEYTFFANINDAAERFEIWFTSPMGEEEINNTDNINIYSYDNILFLKTQKETSGQMNIYNSMGQQVHQRYLKNFKTEQVELHLTPGSYFVEFVTGDMIKTVKIIL